MSDEREQAGAPVEETAVSATEVQAAVDRANEVGAEETAMPVMQTEVLPAEAPPAAVPAAAPATETSVMPEAAPYAPAEFGAATPYEAERPVIAVAEELPSAAPAIPTPAPFSMGEPGGDGEIRISADHPMAAFYTQTPLPPEARGNRLAGVLISLLATVAFAVVYAGVVALLLAPQLPPSRFVGVLVDELLMWGPIFSVIAFFIGMVVIVLVVGRAGWWAYVLGGFLVAMFVWAATVAGLIVDAAGFGGLGDIHFGDVVELALLPPVIAAMIVAREATVWFGAWIGFRGRRISRANAEALAAYEVAMAESQAKPL